MSIGLLAIVAGSPFLLGQSDSGWNEDSKIMEVMFWGLERLAAVAGARQ